MRGGLPAFLTLVAEPSRGPEHIGGTGAPLTLIRAR